MTIIIGLLSAIGALAAAAIVAWLLDKFFGIKVGPRREDKRLRYPPQKGWVYVISNVGSFGEDVFKIGMTTKDPHSPTGRIKDLSGPAVPFPFDVHGVVYSKDARGLERTLHKLFEHFRVNKVSKRKEFFRVSLEQVMEAIKDEGLKPDKPWIIEPPAEQYRKSTNE